MRPYYEQSGITIYHGDCREVLPELPPAAFDIVFTSPPYNLGNTSGGGMPGKNLGHYDPRGGMGGRGGGASATGKWSGGALAHGYDDYNDNMPHDEYCAWQRETLRACWAQISDKGAVFYNHKPRILNGQLVTPFDYLPQGIPIRQVVIWQRAGGVNFSPAFYLPTHEWIVVLAKPDFRLKSKGASGAGDVWSIAQESNPYHPAPFPESLPLTAIETTGARRVLDPFMGIGTTLKAAKRLSRQAVGIEINERYCERAALDLSQESLFSGDPVGGSVPDDQGTLQLPE